MGTGVWFKNIINKKKFKGDRQDKLKRYSAPEKLNGGKEEPCSEKKLPVLANGSAVQNHGISCASIEDASATRIQTAYRAYLARKAFRRMRGMARLQNLVECDFIKKQASTALNHLHSWTRIQAKIRARRVHMATEGRMRQKKLENQLKLDAKLHDLEVEWSGGTETMDEALARIHQREEAAVRRERAMAYAFSHQWRSNSNPGFGSGDHEISKANWGWSWMDRWIAARPWETRLPARDSPKKPNNRQPNKTTTPKNVATPVRKIPARVKLISPNGKARKLSYEAADQKTTLSQKVKNKNENNKTKNEPE